MPSGRRLWFGIFKLAIWTALVMLFFRLLGMIVGGNFREFWVLIAAAVTIFITFVVNLLKRFQLPGDTENGHTASPTLSALPNGANAINLYGEGQVMAEKPKVIIQSPGNVTINNTTNHNNVQGGIIGSGTVNVHQYGDKTPSMPIPSALQPDDSVVLLPMKDTANLDELQEYADKLMGKAIAENTVRNILERADVESCGEENRGRARPQTLSARTGGEGHCRLRRHQKSEVKRRSHASKIQNLFFRIARSMRAFLCFDAFNRHSHASISFDRFPDLWMVHLVRLERRARQRH